jgi:hypothetical protein
MGFQSLPILVPTLIDPLNSTTISLGSNATFTGTFTNLIAFPVVDVVINTDQSGTLFLDVSSDGVTIAQTTSFAVTSTLLFRSPFSWQYIRLRYTNGATAQTTFFLQCILRPIDPGLASLPLNRTVSTNSIAPLNRAILNAQAPSGFYQSLQCDASNILLVDVSNFPATQPVSGTVDAWLSDGSGNDVTSQVNGTQRALDVGIDVGGVQVDPRSIRTLTSTDTVTANAGTGNFTVVQPTGTNLHTVVDSGSITVTQATGTNLHTVLDSGTLTSITNALPTGANTIGAVTQASGPWTSNITQISGSAIATAATGIVKIGLTDGSGNAVTSQVNGSQRALDVGIDVAGVQVDPRQIRTLTSSDIVTADQGGAPWSQNITQIAGSTILTAATGIAKVGLTDGSGTSVTVGQKTMVSSLPVVIASDQVSAIPQVEYISRFTKNNQSYSTSTTVSMATSGTDNPLILIRNPSGSGKVFYLWGINCGVSVSNVLGTFRLFINPTVTVNGVSQTPVSLNGGGGAGASSMLVTTLPTVTANGSQIENGVTGQNSDSIHMGDGFIIAIQANNSILLTGNPGSNARNAELAIKWVEL